MHDLQIWVGGNLAARKICIQIGHFGPHQPDTVQRSAAFVAWSHAFHVHGNASERYLALFLLGSLSQARRQTIAAKGYRLWIGTWWEITKRSSKTPDLCPASRVRRQDV